MRKEKAIQALKKEKRTALHENKVAFNMAIKALSQEPILDKIKAEIEKQEKWLLQAGYNQYNVDIALSAIKSLLKESEV